MIYKKHLSEPHFSNVKNGKKIIEGRLNKGSFSEFKVNDIIEWFNDDGGKKRKIRTKIISIGHYKTFENMIRKERLKNTLPEQSLIKNGAQVYYQFYSKTDEKKYGVLAFRLKLIKN